MSNLAEKILTEFTEEEKVIIKSWAENAIVIRNDSELTAQEKVKKIYNISNNSWVIKKFFNATYRLIKRNGWDERSLPSKLAIAGAVLGLGTVGGNFVGIASAGFGVSLPFFVLTSAGGALLGTIVQEINKKD